jgi:hypothetical protein
MKPPSTRISFIRSVMAGLLTGIIAAVVNLVFVFIYRSLTGINAYNFYISPLFIFIGIPLILILSGILLFALVRYLRKGLTWFITFFILLTIFGIMICIFYPEPVGGKGLLIGLEVITGLAAARVLPYLAMHPGIFMTRLGRDAS